MKQFTMGAVVNTIDNSTLLENYYVTKAEAVAFNEQKL